MIAGHDTTAFQLSWIIIELAKAPEIVKKFRVELDAIFPERNGNGRVEFTPQHLSKLNYLNLIIKEGMRLWPASAVGSSRIVMQDIKYGDNKIIPKGANAGIGFFAMYRNGIQNADKYIPERWLDTDIDAAKLKEFVPIFSLGKRACVGQQLALLELKLVLATLFYSYDFEVTTEVEEMFYVTLRPENCNLKVTKRK